MATQKINEGPEHLAKAEKYLNLFFPDCDSAASEYGKAVVAFKNAKQFEQAKHACLREAMAHENNRGLFHAAKAYEQAGMMLNEMQKLREAVQLIEKASTIYLENGTPDMAAMALEHARKLIENVDPEQAVQLESYSILGFNGSEDCAPLEQLLDQQDQDQVSEFCNSPLFKYMDNDYAKLGLSLVVPGGGIKKSPATPQAKPDSVAPAAPEEEEDKYSEYGKAVVAFKNAKQFEQAKHACLREAMAHENNRGLFHAAKAYEQAGMMLNEMQKLREAVQLIEKASTIYLENGTPDMAAMALEHARKLIENVDPEQAVQLESYSILGFNGSEDCAPLEQLLDQQDQDQVSEFCNSPLFKYMDNDYAKLGLSLVVPGGGIKKSPATPQAKPDSVAPAAPEEEEDKYSGGLC
ncbi:Gamma-soluble NSF attachment protein [Heterocephalus glaber]|uniref:Gamma-soluble NSF attachment protein n=1 Tax=Heterocephalus glaber TaxID=10181 RepID=G5BUB0_HETGA|nr:Gamma-soluble NSF attachment protein [Heterocephalus glaber]